jgi:hypothetical protein
MLDALRVIIHYNRYSEKEQRAVFVYERKSRPEGEMDGRRVVCHSGVGVPIMALLV